MTSSTRERWSSFSFRLLQGDALQCNSKRKRKILRKRKRKIGYLLMCSFRLALFSLAIAVSVGRNYGAEQNLHNWRPGYEGHGTTHEQMGQLHWPPTEYTIYQSSVNYTQDRTTNATGMTPIFNITHFIFRSLFTDNPSLPPGYIVVKDDDTLVLGPKVDQNDWKDLLSQYWLLILWVSLLVAFIIVIPFIGVCYCCFCCCRRCQPGCPPCTAKRDARRRGCCGICLMLLILGLIFGLIIAYVSNKLMERGFDDAANTMRRGSEDTCAFLQDVSDHIYHLFVYNFEELETHIVDQLNNANKHIFLDFADTSGSNALAELDRILDNMNEALGIMRQVDFLEKELRFYGSQFRDALRGLKRDINWGTHNLCGLDKCYQYLPTRSVEYLDTSKCLHFDIIPNSTVFVESIEKIIHLHLALIPKLAMERLHSVGERIKEQIDRITPKLIRNIQRGRETFIEHATQIKNIIDAVISDVHLNTLRSSKSFEDVYETFGTERAIITIMVLLIILSIIIILIAGLICGCCGAQPSASATTTSCSTATGALCLLLGILIIFCVFSFITLVGLFYFLIGALTYESACAPLVDQEKSTLFRQVNFTIDLNRFLSKKTKVNDESNDTEKPENLLPPLSLSNAIDACSANQSIFDMLRANNLYDVNDLKRLRILPHNRESHPLLYDDMSDVILLTEQEKIKLNNMRRGNLSIYHSSLYVSHLCTKFTPVSLITLGEDFAHLAHELYGSPNWRISAHYSYKNDHLNAHAYHNSFVEPLTNIIEKIKKKITQIDELILYENHDFGTSIDILVKVIEKAEIFIQKHGKDFINTLGVNLTDSMNEQIKDYITMVIQESNENVGHCGPLAYIYYNGVDLICHRLIDPLNGLWLGVFTCSILFLPILIVSQRLMCLYKTVYLTSPPVVAVVILERGCPVCTGAEYTPPPIITCGGGQQTYCSCQPGTRGQRSKRPRLSGGTLSVEQEIDDIDFEVMVEEPPTCSKHKRD